MLKKITNYLTHLLPELNISCINECKKKKSQKVSKTKQTIKKKLISMSKAMLPLSVRWKRERERERERERVRERTNKNS